MSKKRKNDERKIGNTKANSNLKNNNDNAEIKNTNVNQKAKNTKNINKITLVAKTPNQKDVLKSLWQNRITFISGSAGTGKTFISATYGLMELIRGKFERMIITRPCVEAYGENMGFLPGTLFDKAEPFLRSVIDVFGDHAPTNDINRLMEEEVISIVPLAYMRGRTFKNSYIIGDEMQNSSVSQMMLLLTRLGENSKMVITGDLTQSDLGDGINGLKDAIERFEKVEGIGICKLQREDIVRDPLVQVIVDKYEKEDHGL